VAAIAVRRFESCRLRHRPVAQPGSEQWASNPRAPVRIGPGCPCRCAGCRSPSGDRQPRESETLACIVDLSAAEARSFSLSTTSSCSARLLPARCDVVQRQDARLLTGRRWFESSRRSLATHHACPDRLTVEDAGLSHRKRGFDSRSGYFTARPRTRLETRPGCLPGEAGSTPVEGVHLAVAQW
jgi:hypothetical protein